MTEGTLLISQQQHECLANVGERLRYCREQQGFTLESVAARTKIQRRILHAIETGDAATLPEPIYIKGFIKQYANAIGLDGVALAEEFPVDSNLERIHTPWTETTSQAQLRPLHLYFLYFLVVVAAVFGLSHVVRQSMSGAVSPAVSASQTDDLTASPAPSPAATPEAAPVATTQAEPDAAEDEAENDAADEPAGEADPEATPAAETEPPADENPEAASEPAEPESEAAADDRPTTSADPAPADAAEQAIQVQGFARSIRFPAEVAIPSGKPVNVALNLSSQSWVRVAVDGKTEFEGILSEGTQRTWSGDREVTVRAGNAGAVQVKFNSGDPGPLGAAGSVTEVTYKSDGTTSP
jgi:cytoskeletal protein RodZ